MKYYIKTIFGELIPDDAILLNEEKINENMSDYLKYDNSYFFS